LQLATAATALGPLGGTTGIQRLEISHGGPV
jgi:hypothetical protein